MTMASSIHSSKITQDLSDCIAELKGYFLRTKAPINDDSATLHRFEEKLESLLLFGLRDKPGLLGTKKSYWEYICSCFSNERRIHEGLKFVKSLAEVKTSLGRGRAFIRFCLMQKCLADTLQSCFMNCKTTKDYYSEKSFLLQKKTWSSFITILYDLNDLNFDLMACHNELDVSWPSFARKHFVSPESMSHSRTYSSSSLYSFTSQNDEVVLPNGLNASLSHNQEDATDKSLMKLEVSKLSDMNEELTNQNQSLLKENETLVAEKSEIEMIVKNLKKECELLNAQLESLNNKEIEHNASCLVSKVEDSKPLLSHSNVSCEIISPNCQENVSSLKKSKDIPEELKCQALSSIGIDSASLSQLQEELFRNKISQSLKRSFSDTCLLSVKNISQKQKASKFYNLSSCGKKSSDLKFLISCLCEYKNTKMFEHLSDSSEFDSMAKNKANINGGLEVSNLCDDGSCSGICKKLILSGKNSDSSEEKLLLEIKTLICNVLTCIPKSNTLLEQYVLQLKIFYDSLESKFTNEAERLKKGESYLDKTYVGYLKNVLVEQDNLINALLDKVDTSLKRTEKLNSNVQNLKNLLRSYGFSKLGDESKCNVKVLEPAVESLSPSKFGDAFIPELFSGTSLIPSLTIINSFLPKLSNLSAKVDELQLFLDCSLESNNNLISGVKAQELHLKGITKEIEQAQQLVSVLKEQHRKLQSTEGILKYDLQEKRKLLNVLKEELETTREDWNMVRVKNSKSEVEWQELRKEFVQRHKQTSEESGFVDDKGLDEQNCSHINSLSDYKSGEESNRVPLDASNIDVEHKNSFDEPTKKSRLELLEEQCQLLYSNLLKGSKRREEIDNRLETMCKTIEKCGTIRHSERFSHINNCENLNDTLVDSSAEELSESNVFDSDNVANSPQLSSNIGSLNSDCSLYAPTNCSLTENEGYDFQIRNTDVGNPLLSCDMLSNMDKCSNSDQDKLTSKSNSSNKVICFSDNNVYIPHFAPTSDLPNLSISDAQNVSLNEVDALVNKEKDLEDRINQSKIVDSHLPSNKNSVAVEIDTLKKHVSNLEQEKIILQCKVHEVETKSLLISTKLDETTQQLIMSKASKEHELSALQFQLNTEALKYERALKEFSEQNVGLESMKQKVTEQEELILTLEEALAEISSERENEKELQWQELQDLQISLEAREEECVTLCEDLEKSISCIEEERSKNDELLSQLENLKAYTQRDKDTFASELIQLQNDTRQLKKRLVKLLKEKDVLWKRNDYLAYLQKVKISDRWINDHEVSCCLGCKSSFSFLLRKHHCRHCGRIFCYSCSNNWLLTASSSKQIRVCNECYRQHLEIKTESRRDSCVPEIEEESEDEALLEEDQSSIAESILSLPVTKGRSPKQSSPLFASAPDLHFVSKYDTSSQSNSFLEENMEMCGEIKACGSGLKNAPEIDSNINLIKGNADQNIKGDNGVDPSQIISTNTIEAAKNGFSGELITIAKSKCFLYVLNEKSLTELQWSFYNNCEILNITVFKENDADASGEKTVYYYSKHKTCDTIILQTPGIYSFCFDNTSRQCDITVRYLFKAKCLFPVTSH